MATEERHHPVHVLQPGLIDVQEHPIDALNLKRHMLIEDISNAAGYRHIKLRSRGSAFGPLTASAAQ